MKKLVFVKPGKKGLICMHPESNAVLPQKGAYWPDNSATRRAILAGDVVEAEPPKSRAK